MTEFAKVSTAVALCSLSLTLSSDANAEWIRLSSGEVLNVKILETTDTTIRMSHPVLGEITLPRASVQILPEVIEPAQTAETEPALPAQTAPSATSEPAQTAPAEPPATAPATTVPAPPAKLWTFKFIAAAALTEGNSESANASVIFNAARETTETKLAMDAGYFFAESGGDRSTNRFTAGGRHDWLNPGSKWFFFADARYDWDEFQSWDSRINTHIGLGYKIFEPPKFKLNALGGIGLVKEFGSDNEDVRPEALIGLEGKYDFAEKHAIEFSTILYPDLLELGEYRWVNSVAYAVLLDQTTNLSLTSGMQHEYQSLVDEGREHNDFRVYAGVQLEF